MEMLYIVLLITFVSVIVAQCPSNQPVKFFLHDNPSHFQCGQCKPGQYFPQDTNVPVGYFCNPHGEFQKIVHHPNWGNRCQHDHRLFWRTKAQSSCGGSGLRCFQMDNDGFGRCFQCVGNTLDPYSGAVCFQNQFQAADSGLTILHSRIGLISWQIYLLVAVCFAIKVFSEVATVVCLCFGKYMQRRKELMAGVSQNDG